MNVSLTPELEKLVGQRVASGMYHSASEVIREALRLLLDRDSVRKLQLDQLRRQVARGIEQADSGAVSPFNPRKIRALARKQLARSRKG